MVSEEPMSIRLPGASPVLESAECEAEAKRVESAGFLRRVREGVDRRWQRLAIGWASRTGQYERYRDIEWSRVGRLVFVCSGNICRSPFAEHLAHASGWQAVSCGTTAWPGALADPTAVSVAHGLGVDLGNHRSGHIGDIELDPTDLLVGMDIRHLHACQRRAEELGAQSTLLGLWDGVHPVIIEDPFGRPVAEFAACFMRISDCLREMLAMASTSTSQRS